MQNQKQLRLNGTHDIQLSLHYTINILSALPCRETANSDQKLKANFEIEKLYHTMIFLLADGKQLGSKPYINHITQLTYKYNFA